MNILVFNAGSTSLKFSLFSRAPAAPLASGQIDWASGDRQRAALSLNAPLAPPLCEIVGVPTDQKAAATALQALSRYLPQEAPIGAVGHRVVHGGGAFGEAVPISHAVLEAIDRHAELAPLHNPPALDVIRFAQAALPSALQVAVFDTAFFAGLPPRAFLYPLPYEWYTDFGIRRFGFHGISHQYCSRRAAEFLHRDPASLRIVSCHLGGGCSAAAIQGGSPIASTMGFTPLDGLMMGTRCGSIDPGILLHLQRQHGLTLDQIDKALHHRSGLLGVSGVSPDITTIEQAAQGGHPRAQLAVDLFADRVRSAIASLAASMGGIDVVLFTDRVGEYSPAVRAAACTGLACLGVHLDSDRNINAQADMDIATETSPVRILVLHTREELLIAQETARHFPPSPAI
jgi:acetate kinase